VVSPDPSVPHLRDYGAADEPAAIRLWLRAWTAAMPEIDFNARLDWWRDRWRSHLVPRNRIVMAEVAGSPVGFVVLDPATGYLDQIVVDPGYWGSSVAGRLIETAKELSPAGVELDVNQSNLRAIRFYERCGFKRVRESSNPLSGRPTYVYAWRPAS
jgi:putative acetyltransferase